MKRWLVKSDPEEYGAADLETDGTTDWTGVRNPTALIHMRNMTVGDEVLVYHSGKDKAVVATATVVKAAYPDPTSASDKPVAVDLQFANWVATPVTLKQIKADAAFAEFDLVRMSRLSVMPVPAKLYTKLIKMAGGTR